MRWVVVACLLVAGCAVQTETASDSFGPIQAADFHCPKAGTRVTFATGSVVSYASVDEKDPVLCKGVYGNRNTYRNLYNYWNANSSIIEDVAPAMAQLFPAVKGKSVHFVHFSSPMGAGTFSQRYQETWRVLGGDEVRLGGRSVHTIVFEREAAGTDATNTSLMRYKLWLAPELGLWLRSDSVMVRGYTPGQSFSVVDVVVP